MNRILITLITAISLSAISFGQQANVFIRGRLTGLTEGTVISLSTTSPDARLRDELKNTDSTLAICKVDGSFEFDVRPFLDGQLYELKIHGLSSACILFLSQGDKMFIEGDISQWPIISIKGSAATAEWIKYKKEFDPLARSNKAEADLFRKKFIEENRQSPVAAFVIYNGGGLKYQERKAYYDKLTLATKKSYWGRMMERFINYVKKYDSIALQLQPGKIVPDFDVTNEFGIKTSLSALLSKSKYSLIDFWGTYCKPCFDGFEKLRPIYANFHERGFNIIAVANDKDTRKWKSILEKHKYPWVNVLDNVEKAMSAKFALEGIPGYILVDSKGQILLVELLQFGPDGIQLLQRASGQRLDNIYETINAHLNKFLADSKN